MIPEGTTNFGLLLMNDSESPNTTSWTALPIIYDDNYKNILQVKIQKEFKVTPHYLIILQDHDEGYKMGVYLCIGQPIHNVNISDAVHIKNVIGLQNEFKDVQDYILKNLQFLVM